MLSNSLRTSFRTALRNFRAHSSYSAINLLGLAVGLAVSLLIFLFVRHELDYDAYHEHSDRTHRLILDGRISGRALVAPVVPAPMGETLVQDYASVEASARIFAFTQEQQLTVDDRAFLRDDVLMADSSLFDLLDFEFLRGDPGSALDEPGTLVLTASMAERLFDQNDALGQTVIIGDTTRVEVDGVIADPPQNSHLQFSALRTLLDFPQAASTQWISNNYVTYVRLSSGADPGALIAQFPDMFERYAGPQLMEQMGISYDQFREAGNQLAYTMQPLEDVHLKSNFEIDIQTPGNISYVYMFSAIAVFILLLACINFMNLSTARAATRAREVGVRKTVGSSRGQLIGQFLAESTVMATLASVVAVGLVAVAIPFYGALTGINFSFSTLLQPIIVLGVLGGIVIVGLVAGLYPAFYLSSFEPARVLKSEQPLGSSQSLLRNSLVVFQFAISIALLIGTFVVQRQLDFIQNTRLGFDRDHIVVLERAFMLGDQAESFKDQLRGHSNILAVGAANSIPGGIHGGSAYMPEGVTNEEAILMAPIYVDTDFVEAMGIEMVEGRDFSPDFPGDSTAFYINRAALEKIGWESATGRMMRTPRGPGEVFSGEIVGVIENYHFNTLRQEISPAAYQLAQGFTPGNLVIRVTGDDVPGTLEHIRSTWDNFRPGQPVTLSFLDERYGELYQSDRRLARLFKGFSGFAIFIAALGLFGLGMFVTEQRTKEIGIRKALGASVGQVIVLLTKDFTRLVVIAFALAVPIAWYGMSRWLDGFIYRTSMGWGVFVLSGAIAIAVAWLTISYQSIKAASRNPVRALQRS